MRARCHLVSNNQFASFDPPNTDSTFYSFGGQRPIDGFIATVFSAKGGSGTAPASLTETRLSSDVFGSISTDGQTITQQNFIDGWYSQLSAVGGPYPSDGSDQVISYYNRIATWAGFCPGSGVPYQNTADYVCISPSFGIEHDRLTIKNCSSNTPLLSTLADLLPSANYCKFGVYFFV